MFTIFKDKHYLKITSIVVTVLFLSNYAALSSPVCDSRAEYLAPNSFADSDFRNNDTGTEMMSAMEELEQNQRHFPASIDKTKGNSVYKKNDRIRQISDVMGIDENGTFVRGSKFAHFCKALDLSVRDTERILKLVLEKRFQMYRDKGLNPKNIDPKKLKVLLSARFPYLFGSHKNDNNCTINRRALKKLPVESRLVILAVGLSHEILGHECFSITDEKRLTMEDISLTLSILRQNNININSYLSNLSTILQKGDLSEQTDYFTELSLYSLLSAHEISRGVFTTQEDKPITGFEHLKAREWEILNRIWVEISPKLDKFPRIGVRIVEGNSLPFYFASHSDQLLENSSTTFIEDPFLAHSGQKTGAAFVINRSLLTKKYEELLRIELESAVRSLIVKQYNKSKHIEELDPIPPAQLEIAEQFHKLEALRRSMRTEDIRDKVNIFKYFHNAASRITEDLETALRQTGLDDDLLFQHPLVTDRLAGMFRLFSLYSDLLYSSFPSSQIKKIWRYLRSRKRHRGLLQLLDSYIRSSKEETDYNAEKITLNYLSFNSLLKNVINYCRRLPCLSRTQGRYFGKKDIYAARKDFEENNWLEDSNSIVNYYNLLELGIPEKMLLKDPETRMLKIPVRDLIHSTRNIKRTAKILKNQIGIDPAEFYKAYLYISSADFYSKKSTKSRVRKCRGKIYSYIRQIEEFLSEHISLPEEDTAYLAAVEILTMFYTAMHYAEQRYDTKFMHRRNIVHIEILLDRMLKHKNSLISKILRDSTHRDTIPQKRYEDTAYRLCQILHTKRISAHTKLLVKSTIFIISLLRNLGDLKYRSRNAIYIRRELLWWKTYCQNAKIRNAAVLAWDEFHRNVKELIGPNSLTEDDWLVLNPDFDNTAEESSKIKLIFQEPEPAVKSNLVANAPESEFSIIKSQIISALTDPDNALIKESIYFVNEEIIDESEYEHVHVKLLDFGYRKEGYHVQVKTKDGLIREFVLKRIKDKYLFSEHQEERELNILANEYIPRQGTIYNNESLFYTEAMAKGVELHDLTTGQRPDSRPLPFLCPRHGEERDEYLERILYGLYKCIRADFRILYNLDFTYIINDKSPKNVFIDSDSEPTRIDLGIHNTPSDNEDEFQELINFVSRLQYILNLEATLDKYIFKAAEEVGENIMALWNDPTYAINYTDLFNAIIFGDNFKIGIKFLLKTEEELRRLLSGKTNFRDLYANIIRLRLNWNEGNISEYFGLVRTENIVDLDWLRKQFTSFFDALLQKLNDDYERIDSDLDYRAYYYERFDADSLSELKRKFKYYIELIRNRRRTFGETLAEELDASV